MVCRRRSSGLVMSVVIILLALEYSSAKCDQVNHGTKTEKYVFLLRDTKFVLGRKMLQGIDRKLAGLDNSSPEAQTENKRFKAQQHPQELMSNVAKREHSITKNPDESKAFEEAADEFANLMRKDYKGMARRKPPINNHEPKD